MSLSFLKCEKQHLESVKELWWNQKSFMGFPPERFQDFIWNYIKEQITCPREPVSYYCLTDHEGSCLAMFGFYDWCCLNSASLNLVLIDHQIVQMGLRTSLLKLIMLKMFEIGISRSIHHYYSAIPKKKRSQYDIFWEKNIPQINLISRNIYEDVPANQKPVKEHSWEIMWEEIYPIDIIINCTSINDVRDESLAQMKASIKAEIAGTQILC